MGRQSSNIITQRERRTVTPESDTHCTVPTVQVEKKVHNEFDTACVHLLLDSIFDWYQQVDNFSDRNLIPRFACHCQILPVHGLFGKPHGHRSAGSRIHGSGLDPFVRASVSKGPSPGPFFLKLDINSSYVLERVQVARGPGALIRNRLETRRRSAK